MEGKFHAIKLLPIVILSTCVMWAHLPFSFFPSYFPFFLVGGGGVVGEGVCCPQFIS